MGTPTGSLKGDPTHPIALKTNREDPPGKTSRTGGTGGRRFASHVFTGARQLIIPVGFHSRASFQAEPGPLPARPEGKPSVNADQLLLAAAVSAQPARHADSASFGDRHRTTFAPFSTMMLGVRGPSSPHREQAFMVVGCRLPFLSLSPPLSSSSPPPLSPLALAFWLFSFFFLFFTAWLEMAGLYTQAAQRGLRLPIEECKTAKEKQEAENGDGPAGGA